jgi:hypothetical protein
MSCRGIISDRVLVESESDLAIAYNLAKQIQLVLLTQR